jgi:hypothetical protein
MADRTRDPPPPSGQEPGHYGAGYGEQVPENATPQLGPATDGDPPPKTRGEAAPEDAPAKAGTTAEDGEAVAFTPDDVHARPPDHPPTEAAPESEKAGLIFERS